MTKRPIIVIELEDAQRYRKSLRWALKKFETAFERTDDKQLKQTINRHGPVLDELLEELK